MEISDKIQLVSVAVALFASVSSIVMYAISARKSSKAQCEASRAYLSFMIESLDPQMNVYYMLIKNYGNSPATLKNIIYPPELKQKQLNHIQNPLWLGLENNRKMTIFPHETIYFPFVIDGLPLSEFTITYVYSTLKKDRTERATLNLEVAAQNRKFQNPKALIR